jgi:hypothetical protein
MYYKEIDKIICGKVVGRTKDGVSTLFPDMLGEHDLDCRIAVREIDNLGRYFRPDEWYEQ